MKFLIFLIAVVVLLWLLRSALRRHLPKAKSDPAPKEAKPMLACAQCGVHLPRDEALPGRGGVFCGEPHRAEYEREHPER